MKTILQQFIGRVRDMLGCSYFSHMNRRNRTADWNEYVQVLQLIALYGKEYLNKEYMMQLKMHLLRINEKYLFFKDKIKKYEIIKITRRILKEFYDIDGEKIINKKYDEKDNEDVENILSEMIEAQTLRGEYGNRGRDEDSQFDHDL